MNCPNCRTEITGIQQFCMNCGTSLFPTKESNSSKTSDTFIMIFLSFLFFSELIRFALQKIIPNWYESPTKLLFIGLNLISGISVILLALAIKEKNKKTIAIILAALHALYIIYSNVDWFLH
ncbi:zinc ribbon domain-containing protein [Kordia sp.]|uniref:zinc ribbon domain-containing protein n=1 Tax=Kordia sp. TaxID=1965332 RepID=UPI003B5CA9F6